MHPLYLIRLASSLPESAILLCTVGAGGSRGPVVGGTRAPVVGGTRGPIVDGTRGPVGAGAG